MRGPSTREEQPPGGVPLLCGPKWARRPFHWDSNGPTEQVQCTAVPGQTLAFYRRIPRQPPTTVDWPSVEHHPSVVGGPPSAVGGGLFIADRGVGRQQWAVDCRWSAIACLRPCQALRNKETQATPLLKELRGHTRPTEEPVKAPGHLSLSRPLRVSVGWAEGQMQRLWWTPPTPDTHAHTGKRGPVGYTPKKAPNVTKTRLLLNPPLRGGGHVGPWPAAVDPAPPPPHTHQTNFHQKSQNFDGNNSDRCSDRGACF